MYNVYRYAHTTNPLDGTGTQKDERDRRFPSAERDRETEWKKQVCTVGKETRQFDFNWLRHICCQDLLSKSEANSVVEASACKALDSLGPGGAQFRCRGYDVVPIAPRRPEGSQGPHRSLLTVSVEPWGLASFVGSWLSRSLWSTSSGDRWEAKRFECWEAIGCIFLEASQKHNDDASEKPKACCWCRCSKISTDFC